MEVRAGRSTLALKVGHLAITEHMIWLGADVSRWRSATEALAKP